MRDAGLGGRGGGGAGGGGDGGGHARVVHVVAEVEERRGEVRAHLRQVWRRGRPAGAGARDPGPAGRLGRRFGKGARARRVQFHGFELRSEGRQDFLRSISLQTMSPPSKSAQGSKLC